MESAFWKSAAEKLVDLHRKFVEIEANVNAFVDKYSKLEGSIERLLQRIEDKNGDLNKRLSSLEAGFDAVVEKATKEAVIQLYREHLNAGGAGPFPIQLRPNGWIPLHTFQMVVRALGPATFGSAIFRTRREGGLLTPKRRNRAAASFRRPAEASGR
jgi:hypothetical protein